MASLQMKAVCIFTAREKRLQKKAAILLPYKGDADGIAFFVDVNTGFQVSLFLNHSGSATPVFKRSFIL